MPGVRDPLLSAIPVGADEEPAEQLRKDGGGPSSTTARPPSGRSTLQEARRAGPLGWLQLLGPGLITGASDDGPSGIGTSSQVGSPYGYGLRWMARFTHPLLAAVHELCARIALQTGPPSGSRGVGRSPPGWSGGDEPFTASVPNTGGDVLRHPDLGDGPPRPRRAPIQTASQAARALAPLAGRFAFLLFAVGLIGTGLLAIPIRSGSAAYAAKECFAFEGDLGAKPWYRPTSYGVIVAGTLAGVAMTFLHIDAIQALFWTAVIDGVVAAPLLILIVRLRADPRVMRTRASGRPSQALTWTATAVMGGAALALIGSLLLTIRI